ncbi:MAG: hypothetical protein K2P78_06505, partial [Gemmataceae bacterium]|nr:hypothetical protein [Gemmataceae bacterium]
MPTSLRVERLEDRTTPAVYVRFDFTYDSSGFFADPARRDALDRAAAELTAGMLDDLAAVVPGGGDSWIAYTTRPDTGASVRLTDLTIARGEVLVFVGVRPLPGATVAQASLFTPAGTATGSAAWRDRVLGRGQAGAL